MHQPTCLRIYPGADGAFTLYQDDGISLDYLRGKSSRIRLRWDDAHRMLYIGPDGSSGQHGMPQVRTFRVRLMTGDKEVTVLYAGKNIVVRL